MISLAGGVAPFGDPGITDRSHLPRAFRSVPRPSSPLSAKASTRCPCFALDHRHSRRRERRTTAAHRAKPPGHQPRRARRPPSAQFQAPALLAPSRPAKLRFARRQPRTQSAAQHGLRRSRPRMKTLLRTHRRGGQHLAAPAKTVGRVRLGHITTLSSPVNQQTRRGRRGGRCLRQTLLSAPRRRTRRPAKPCFAGGGGERIRTDDLLLAKQALSQLSYTPSQEGRAPARSPTPAPDP